MFRKMFPDSDIAQKFSCGEKKCSYLCRFGLAPHFHKLLLQRVKDADEFVLMYDESFNRSTQNKQMDVHMRLWDTNGTVSSRYLCSKFMGHATAEQMLDKFNECVGNLNLAKLIQISMDGPNVNWKLYDLMQQDLKVNLNVSLLNIGSCNLHVVHGAFKDGAKASGWDLDHFLSSMFWLFNESPARREDFTTATNCSTFPLKWCNHRWLENTTVCERALFLLPFTKKYLAAVSAGSCPRPQNKSFEAVRESCTDQLLAAKLKFSVSVAKQIEPFLAQYQTDKPMIPFISGDIYKLLKSLMNRFVKPALMKEVKSVSDLTKIDISRNDNIVDYSKIDVGFVTENALKDLGKKVTDKQLLEFRLACKHWLKASATKLLEKTAVQFPLAHNLSFLDPRLISQTDKNKVRLKSILRLLVQNSRVNESDVDDILQQYIDYAGKMIETELKRFTDFEPGKCRVDTLMFETMEDKEMYSKVWKVVKMLLTLSHGQASVERGFSVNRQTEVENLSEESFVAKRVICDYVQFVGGVHKVDIHCKQLLMAAAGARQKYSLYLDEEKRKTEVAQVDKKRKALTDDIEECKKKKMRLQTDISSLEASADSLLTKAETSHCIKYVTEANSLRRTIKQKTEEVATVEQQLDSLLLQLRDN